MNRWLPRDLTAVPLRKIDEEIATIEHSPMNAPSPTPSVLPTCARLGVRSQVEIAVAAADPECDRPRRHLAYIEADAESLRRGGSTRTAVCTCGWRGPQRGTLELVVDDALTHEGSDMHVAIDRRAVLVKRIASNKAWLSKNWHHGKDLRRPCQANIEADERELAQLDAEETA